MFAPAASRLILRTSDPHLGPLPGPVALAASGGALWVAGGGRGSSAVLRFAGGAWSRCEDVPANGLRSVLAASKGEAWVAGEGGFLAWTDDGGEGFETIETRTRGCLFGLSRDAAGAIWVSGDEGLLLRSSDGVTFARVELGIGERIFRVVPGDDGVGWLVAEHTLGRLDLGSGRLETLLHDASAVINDVASSGGGCWLAVGDAGRLWRSTDGTRFEAVESGTSADLARAISWQGEFWVTTSEGSLRRSADGLAWREQPVAGLEGLRLTSMLPFQGGLLVSGWRYEGQRSVGGLAFVGPGEDAPLAPGSAQP
ncbi:MAG TPA: hypothetical protein VFS43_40610 [Polyangiaceae bacterium]|nr:hypothetical protein [Polyangiaceae bacterium]